MMSVVQKSSGLLLGWCDDLPVQGRYIRRAYKKGDNLPITSIRFRWCLNGWKQLSIIAHGLMDASLLPNFIKSSWVN